MVNLVTMGKFTGIPTQRASAKYGGGTSAGIQYVDRPHKFPSIRVNKVETERVNINISIEEFEEQDYA